MSVWIFRNSVSHVLNMKIAFVTLFRYFCQGGKTSGSAIKKEEKSFKGGENLKAGGEIVIGNKRLIEAVV